MANLFTQYRHFYRLAGAVTILPMNQQFPSVFRAEAFRAFLVLFIPGAFAIFPWVLLANATIPDFANYRQTSEIAYYFGLFCVAISAGMFIENLGSMIEVLCWDRRLLKRPDLNMTNTWRSFLALQYEHQNEPIGHRYLRSILLRMHFVTHFAVSVVLALGGAVVGTVVLGAPSWIVISWLCWAAIFFVPWLLFESYQSALVLAQTRKILVEREVNRRQLHSTQPP